MGIDFSSPPPPRGGVSQNTGQVDVSCLLSSVLVLNLGQTLGHTALSINILGLFESLELGIDGFLDLGKTQKNGPNVLISS